MICSICNEEYINQSELDPAEPCLCGQMAWCSPWKWDRWRGLRSWGRYRTAAYLFKIANGLIMKGNHETNLS